MRNPYLIDDAPNHPTTRLLNGISVETRGIVPKDFLTVLAAIPADREGSFSLVPGAIKPRVKVMPVYCPNPSAPGAIRAHAVVTF